MVCVQNNLSDPTLLRLIDHGFGWKPLVLVNEIAPYRKPRNKALDALNLNKRKAVVQARVDDEKKEVDVAEVPTSGAKDLDEDRSDEFVEDAPPQENERKSPSPDRSERSGVNKEEIDVESYINKLKSTLI